MTRLLAIPLLLVTVLLLSATGMAQTTDTAQTPETVSPEELQRIVTEAQESGAEVIIVRSAPQEMTAAAAAAPTESIDDRALRFRNRFAAILADVPNFPSEAMSTIGGHDSAGGYAWPLLAALLAVVFLGVGALVERLLHRWARVHFMYLFNPTPASRAEKISYLLVRGLMMFAGLVLQIAVALLLVFAFFGDQQHMRVTQLVVIATVAVVRGLLIFFFNLLAPDAPSHRMLHLSDAGATSFYRGLRVMLVISAAFAGLCMWMDLIDLQRNAHKLSLIAGLLITTVIATAFVVWQRQAIAGMVIGPDEGRVGLFRKLVGRNLHVLLGLYFVFAFCLSTFRIVMDEPNAFGLVGGPVLLVFVGFAGYGVALLLVEWAMTPREARESDVAPALAPSQPEPDSLSNDPATGIEMDEPDDDDDEPIAIRPSAMKLLLERAAGIVVAVLTLSGILQLWGLDITQTGFLRGLWEIILIGFLAYLAYSSVNVVIDQKIAEEGGLDDDAPEPGEEGGRGGASRLGTLLPILRYVLVSTIVAIATMIVLSEMGVNIAPLFAGAGVVGIAIGFGAQTLIADIFSGAFFLVDDAFRKGEYIEIDGTRGTVERISIRSMQLRHQNGPVHTIPFSQIKTLTNYSRDWAVMKLPLRLTYDTDPEKVRKLIKKLGVELMENPVFGHQFLAPLKSQGVLQMEDSAMIMRVKFMTRPGEQFTLRKEVYRHIRELFEKEGIKFAHRQVTVRVADAENAPPLSPEQKEAVAGAVAPLIDAEQQAGQQGRGDDR